MSRKKPNIVVTGTPGVGKTSHCELLAFRTGLEHLSINEVVREKGCHEGWDEEHQSWIVDEDKLLGVLEDLGVPKSGGYIIDWHGCDLFPQSWVDLLVVLRTAFLHLYNRLKLRSYAETKLQENLDTEVWGLLLEEAKEAFEEDIVVELRSETEADLEGNVRRMGQWIEKWTQDRENEVEEKEEKDG